MSGLNRYFFCSLLSLLLGLASAFFFARFGIEMGFGDNPCQRSSHKITTPKGGGIGIGIAIVAASFFAGINPVIAVTTTGFIVVGIVSDKKEIFSLTRLAVQLLLSTLLLYLLKPVSFLFVFWIFFIAGSANLYNFMDGIDGIAGLSGATGFFLFLLFHGSCGVHDGYEIIALAGLFSCLGFLVFNFPKARVFMGDTGSLVLGFVFAVLICRFSLTFNDFVLLCSLQLPFYMDELSTMGLRLSRKENVLKPHRTHLYQLLANECSIAHWKISTLYGVVQLFLGSSLIILYHIVPKMVVPVAFFYSLIFILISMMVRRKIA